MQPSPEARLEVVLERLEAVKKVRGGYMARCPSHEDRSPSLSVNLGERLVLLHCWAGCNVNAVRTALKLEWDDLYYDAASNHEPRFVEPEKKTRAFTAERRRAMALEALACSARLQQDAETLERLRVERGWAKTALRNLTVGWTGKKLTMLTHDKTGEPHDILLYDPFMKKGRKMIAGEGRSRQPWPSPETVKTKGSQPLYIVEGEGTAISLASLGLPVVGLPGSVGRPSYDPMATGTWRGVGWHPKWISRFAGPHRFVLIPDCDEVGRALMRAVDYDLTRVGETVVYLDLSPNNMTGFDVGDWLKPAVNLEIRKEALMVLDLAVQTVQKAPTQVEDAREVMRAWYRNYTS